jgi:hypothetical protein
MVAQPSIACPLCPWTPPRDESRASQSDSLCLHLRQSHPTWLPPDLDPSFFSTASLLPCGRCNQIDKRFCSKRALNTHVSHHHNHSRSKRNTELVHASYHMADPRSWKESIRWLHSLDVQPPDHHGNIWRSLPPYTKSEYHSLLDHILKRVHDSTVTHSSHHLHPDHKTTPTPFWNVLLLLDPIILRPPTQDDPSSFSTLISNRMKLIRQGDVCSLYQHALDLPLRPAP